MEKLADEDDKKFITDYCDDQGENFRECLNKITNNSFMILSGTDNIGCIEIVTNIKKDRNVYLMRHLKMIHY